jgi:hypothetical protein
MESVFIHIILLYLFFHVCYVNGRQVERMKLPRREGVVVVMVVDGETRFFIFL